jgi:hypothetical protein
MNNEKREILKKINDLIDKRKELLIQQLPVVHEVDDGIIIRFFTYWDNCEDNTQIKYKKVVNTDKPQEKTIFFYIPKGAYFDLKKREYIGCITCLNGRLEIIIHGETKILEQYNKMCLDDDVFEGKALENSYVLTTSTI